MTKKMIRTPQQRIEFYQQKIKELQEKLKSSGSTLNKDSDGMSEALNALMYLVKTHDVSMGQVIKTISGIKRTGLQIQDPKKKVRKFKTVGSTT